MRTLVWIAVAVATAAFPATARADGIAFAGVKQGGNGTAADGALVHYVTLPLAKQTLVQKVDAQGSVRRYRALTGSWGIPMVAFDGSTGGVSADGQTLVLAQPPIGRMRHVSRFPVLETKTLRPTTIVTLAGSFSFDALSPDGSTLYLIEHVNRKDVAEYQVRAYDLAEKRLFPYVIRDHRSNRVEMYGYPMSRAVSEDGRWAYTLYQGSHHSFVHALDTVARKAVCVDLPMDTPPDYVADAKLVPAPDGGQLTVESRMAGTVAVIDTEKLELVRPVVNRPAAAAEDDAFAWPALAATLAVALIVAGLCVRRLRPDRVSGEPHDGALVACSEDGVVKGVRVVQPEARGRANIVDRPRTQILRPRTAVVELDAGFELVAANIGGAGTHVECARFADGHLRVEDDNGDAASHGEVRRVARGLRRDPKEASAVLGRDQTGETHGTPASSAVASVM